MKINETKIENKQVNINTQTTQKSRTGMGKIRNCMSYVYIHMYVCCVYVCGVCLPIEPKQTSFFILANHSLCVVGFLSMLIMCEEFTFIVHTPSQEQCRQQQLVEERTGCLENRRPRRIRRQKQK